MKASSLTIGKLAEKAGVSVETVRFYQRKDLMEIPESPGGVRQYGTEALRRLQFIRKAQEAGFSLNEIKELMQLDSSHDHHRASELALQKIQQLDAKISELQRARDRLQRLAAQCADEGGQAPCAILAAFDL